MSVKKSGTVSADVVANVDDWLPFEGWDSNVGGVPLADVARKHGIAEATFYRWKAKFGGMELGDARRLKQLEEENRQLKKLVADLSLDKQMLQDVLAKKL